MDFVLQNSDFHYLPLAATSLELLEQSVLTCPPVADPHIRHIHRPKQLAGTLWLIEHIPCRDGGPAGEFHLDRLNLAR